MKKQEKRPNSKLRRERELRGWSQRAVAEYVGTSEQVVTRWESGQHKPNRHFQTQLCNLFGKSAEELGFMNVQTTHEAKEEQTPVSKEHRQKQPLLSTLEQDNQQQELSSLFPQVGLQGITIDYNATSALRTVSQSSSLPDLDMLVRSRRQVLQDILNTARAALTLSPYALLPQDSRKRLEMIMAHPSYVDQEALGDLAAITQRYWGLSKNASIDLLSGIAGHFTTITQLLKDSHPTPIYEELCALASENALLLGKNFHDIREYDLAWQYYKFSLKIAQDTHNTDLWANGVGRIALLLIYWGQPQHALPLLDETRKIEIHNQRLGPWLAAIEAEIHAIMGNVDDCQRALDQAKKVPLSTSLTDDIYATGFNPSRVAGYEGACFVRLRQPERALPALKEAFALCEPTSLRRRSTLLADIGTVHAQLGDVKNACKLILHALDMTTQTKSLVVLQRIYKGRGELDPWKDCAEVKNLDERIFEILTELTRLKESV